MDKSIKTVLISTACLPYEGVASWTTRMNYLLKKENNIDYLTGPKSNIKIEKPVQIFIDKISLSDKIKSKFDFKNKFNLYIRSLEEVLNREENILLQVKSNLDLLKVITAFINKEKLRKNIYHTFPPLNDDNNLFDEIDELILLTNSSYKLLKEQGNNSPFNISISNNDIICN